MEYLKCSTEQLKAMDLDAYTKRLASEMVEALNSTTKREKSLAAAGGDKERK
jgi:hypothetical protein